MSNIIVRKEPEYDEKIALMSEDARYDVADGEARPAPGITSIKNSIKSPSGPPKVPKAFLSNNCIFNCAYCGCRCGRDKERYAFSPGELAAMSVEQAKANRHGIFISSAIYKNADYTQELMIETLKIIRNELNYKGYLHAKVMPGADPMLIYRTGLYADRLSVNIEVAKSEGYSLIAKNKNKNNILTPMGHISGQIKALRKEKDKSRFTPKFATSQTTQLMAGSTGEDDHTILRLAGAMYKKYDLARVYYTAYHYENPAKGYEGLEITKTPAWRVARLYQADRLIKLYGFSPDEIAPDSCSYLSRDMDPKAAWALRNLHLFPVDVERADYEMLLRVPGIGLTLASRIIKARRYTSITEDVLRKLGVSLRRSGSFITFGGRYMGIKSDNPDMLKDPLADMGMEQMTL